MSTRRRIPQSATLPDDDSRRHAIGIFGVLAEAEAHVHGSVRNTVTFRAVDAANSVADIVAAAWIAAIGPVSWGIGPPPPGFGRVETAYGPMPAPATV